MVPRRAGHGAIGEAPDGGEECIGLGVAALGRHLCRQQPMERIDNARIAEPIAEAALRATAQEMAAARGGQRLALVVDGAIQGAAGWSWRGYSHAASSWSRRASRSAATAAK
jgi:hypothetical protein